MACLASITGAICLKPRSPVASGSVASTYRTRGAEGPASLLLTKLAKASNRPRSAVQHQLVSLTAYTERATTKHQLHNWHYATRKHHTSKIRNLI